MTDAPLPTGPPDFVGVGAQRSGTSWWFELIMSHPEVMRPSRRRKELHFFDRFSHQPMKDVHIERYYTRFGREPGTIVGEWTPRYMSDFWTPELLRRAAPDAKLLILLRDPIERYRSGFVHRHRTGAPEGRRRALVAHEAIARGNYATQLKRVWRHFPREQVLVLQYEQCAADPATHYRRTLEYLGIDPSFAPDFARPRGRTTAAQKVELWPDMLDALRAALSRETLELGELLPDFDLGLWKNFAHLTAPADA